MKLNEKLSLIQTKLKVGKGHRNDFGKYNYRNLADIFEGLKPLLDETGCYVTVSDEIVCVNDFNYIKATATFSDGNDTITTEGWARESVQKKGMDDSQITGATSSYARKYACNGLFAIDDTADADSMDNRNHVSVLQENTKGTVETVPDNVVKLKRLSNSVHFKDAVTKTGKSISEGVAEWLNKQKRTDAEILQKYTQLKDLEIGFKNKQNKKEKA